MLQKSNTLERFWAVFAKGECQSVSSTRKPPIGRFGVSKLVLDIGVCSMNTDFG
jgi:hypothetical protein